MSEQADHRAEVPADLPSEPAARTGDGGGETVRTGVARVDEVIAAVEQLDERPLQEHVGVFEAAHEELRRALDADPGPPPGSPAADPA